MAPGTDSTGSPGRHSADVQSGVGVGRGGAGGGSDPRLGFCGTSSCFSAPPAPPPDVPPEPPEPVVARVPPVPDEPPRSVVPPVAPEPVDPVPRAPEDGAGRAAAVFSGVAAGVDRTGPGDAEDGPGSGERAAPGALTDGAALAGVLPPPDGRPESVSPPAEHPVTHRTVSAAAAHHTTGPAPPAPPPPVPSAATPRTIPPPCRPSWTGTFNRKAGVRTIFRGRDAGHIRIL